MVIVFETNVQTSRQANLVIQELITCYPELKINFDLEDCDKILRIEGEEIKAVDISAAVQILGYNCKELPY